MYIFKMWIIELLWQVNLRFSIILLPLFGSDNSQTFDLNFKLFNLFSSS